VSDRVQVGPKVDAELWAEFRESVQDRKGQVRGVLGDELENAIRNYINFGPDKSTGAQLAEFNARLQRIEGAVGTAESDGGDTLSDDSHTHAPSRVRAAEDSKPGANAATEKKVAYLSRELLRAENCDTTADLRSIPVERVRDVVKDEYGFRSDTAKRYVNALVDELDLHKHPSADNIYLTEWAYNEYHDDDNQ